MNTNSDTVVYYAPLDVRIEKNTKGSVLGEGDVLVKVEACAICGTDIKSYFKGNPRIKPPRIMGHEFCGTITKTGKDVMGYHTGQRVTMATTIGCGSCMYCKSGKTNLCRSAEAIGFHYDGAMAPYVLIPKKAVQQGHLVDVGDLDAELASISEPLSCVMNGLGRLPIHEIESALVMGLGPLGLLHSLTLKNKGVKKICCVDFPGKRLDLAKKFGFITVTPDKLDEKYKELTDGEGFGLVVVTAPHNETQAKAVSYARKAGYVSYFASLAVGNEFLNVNSRTIHYNELIVYGTSDSTVKHVEQAVKALKANTEEYKKLITHIMPFSDFETAMEEIKDGNAVKVVLKP